MTRWLQSFDFRKSRYERPNQTWVCGRTSDGCPCRIGPDRRGRCRAEAECRPRQDGGRWVCCRGQDAGGPCREGPRPDGRCAHPVPPCTPVRSVRAKRGLVARWAATVAVGLLVLALAGGQSERWLSPGPLSASHASVDDCASCHQDADAGTLGWLHAAVQRAPATGAGDSKLCLSCHEPGAEPLRAHGLPADRLQRATAPRDGSGAVRPASLSLASRLFGSPVGHPERGQGQSQGQSRRSRDGTVACATCHAEHGGAHANIDALGDGQCQACHVRKFASFTEGHPPFESYPYDRRTRINFDHAGHFRKHFPDSSGDAPTQCADCHRADPRGQQMLSAGFETGCAACHAGDVRGQNVAGSPGLPVLVVPGLDVETLRAREAGIGTWPELADRELTPFMRAILAGDPQLDGALATLRGLDPMDLREAGAAEVDAAARVAWAVKRLLYELIEKGPAALQARLEAGLGTELSQAQVRALAGGLPLAAVRDAATAWFPELASEIRRHRDGEPVPMPASEFGAAPDDESDADAAASDAAGDAGQQDILGGDEGGGANGGSQDDILGGGSDDGGAGDQGDILSGGSGADGGGEQDDILGGSDSGEGGGGQDDILGGSGDAGGDQGDILSGEDGGGQEDILGGGSDDGEQEDILGGGSDGGGEGADNGDILGGGSGSGSDGGGDLLGGGSGGGTQDGADGEGGAADAALPEPNPANWTALGGWYRDYFALLYRPGDHADPFLKGWIDVAGQVRGANGAGGAAGQALVDTLTADGAPGRCAGCHSLDRQDDGALAVNWRGFRPDMAAQGFTRFAHAPHFSRIGDQTGCATCHTLNREADYLAGFDDRDPAGFQSNFQPISAETCADCHVDSAAGNACTQCHNYHVGEVDPQAMSTGLEAMDQEPTDR